MFILIVKIISKNKNIHIVKTVPLEELFSILFIKNWILHPAPAPTTPFFINVSISRTTTFLFYLLPFNVSSLRYIIAAFIILYLTKCMDAVVLLICYYCVFIFDVRGYLFNIYKYFLQEPEPLLYYFIAI